MKSLKLLFLLTSIAISGQINAMSNFTPPTEEQDYTKTQYPIVLVHGVMGFDSVDILGFIGTDYWPTIPYEVMRSGGTVYVAQVSAVNSPEIRGEQLILELDYIAALTGHNKFNLIGHSYGAPTSKYVASVRPDLIASVSTVGGSNDSNQRDEENPATSGSVECDIVCKLMELAVVALGIEHGTEECTSDVDSGLASLSEAAQLSCDAVNHAQEVAGFPIDASFRPEFEIRMEHFNRSHPWGRPDSWCGETDPLASNGIAYYSWSGAQIFTNPLDPSDLAMAAAGAGDIINGIATDGLVDVCRSHWGQVIRDDYPMNHLDETNLLWGLSNPFFNEVALYRQHANRLKQAGF